MLITQKKQYALRAIYELARNREAGPIKTVQIAEVQAIQQRFLEIILNRLKHAGLVSAKRGYCGGFQLMRPPREITVEDVFKSMEDIDEATVCVSCISRMHPLLRLENESKFCAIWRNLFFPLP